jgi:hypothetical protein
MSYMNAYAKIKSAKNPVRAKYFEFLEPKLLTEEEFDAINEYTTSEYKNINWNIRNAIPDKRIDLIMNLFYIAKPNTIGVTVYRGMECRRLPALIFGEVITLDGFVSTSLNRDIARYCNSLISVERCLLEIRIPPGNRALNLERVTAEAGEKEILLPPQCLFTVGNERIEAIEGTTRVIELELKAQPSVSTLHISVG